MSNADVEVRESGTEGLGVFALRGFAAGETVRVVTIVREITDDSPLRPDLDERPEHCAYVDGKVILYGDPDRYYNHSCDPNAWKRYVDGRTEVVARRAIGAGEEIRIDYLINNSGGTTWRCHCGSPRCRGMTGESFFTLPRDVQREYLPYLADWFAAGHADELADLRLARRAASFDEVADLYDRYRPAPPTPVVDAIVDAAGIDARSRVVEFGSGTGQLSVPLAATGAELTCVEPGAHLAAVATRNLAPFRNARVECATFEDWPSPNERVDAIVVANAFHWFDADLRLTKPPALLGPGGRLAILHTHHVRGGSPGFAEASQHAYVHSGLAGDLTFKPPKPDELPVSYPELNEFPAYGSVRRDLFQMPTTYTSEQFAGLLRTDSLVNTLTPGARAQFLDEIVALVDGSFGGRIERAYVYELIVATRR